MWCTEASKQISLDSCFELVQLSLALFGMSYILVWHSLKSQDAPEGLWFCHCAFRVIHPPYYHVITWVAEVIFSLKILTHKILIKPKAYIQNREDMT